MHALFLQTGGEAAGIVALGAAQSLDVFLDLDQPPATGPGCLLVHEWRNDRFRGRRAIAEAARADNVVVPTPFLDVHLSLLQKIEDLSVEQLVAETGVE
jgi:hypothetical protein